MIRQLTINNLALIEHLSIDFHKGFSVFTGETGAGKSILLGAIGLILGERASTDSIRRGADKAEIMGLFEFESIPKDLLLLLEDIDIPVEDNSLIIRRIIARNGKNKVYLNQVPIPLQTLKKIGDHLIDIHGQHDHQSLLQPETANSIINSLPGCVKPWSHYQKAYAEYTKAQRELHSFDRKVQELQQKKDYLEFQYKEISALELKDNEEEELESEFKMLSSSAERINCVSHIGNIIGSYHSDSSLESHIGKIKKHLETLVKFDETAQPWLQEFDNIESFISELNSFCNSYAEDIGVGGSQQRLEEINSRLSKIQRLKKKHILSFEELIEKEQTLQKELDSIDSIEHDRKRLESIVQKAENNAQEVAEKLSKSRKKAAATFDKEITRQMETLGFNGGQWNSHQNKTEALHENGLETIDFLVRTNLGEPFLPLSKSASGGEISRCMLAIKAILSEQDKIPILIFDEIDTGIGGVVAKEVAKAMVALSHSHQVLSITHLHQIASQADNHYQVSKRAENNRTISEIKELSGEDKINEIARMLGGESKISREHAKELLAHR